MVAALLPGLAPFAHAGPPLPSAAVDVTIERTRIVFESKERVRFNLFSLRNPERIVLDLEGLELDAVVAALAAKVGPSHPYIKPLRISRTATQAVRIEFDLKVEAQPLIFSLKPEAGHSHRLVLEVHPSEPVAIAAEPVPQPPITSAPPPALEEMFLSVRINGQGPPQNALVLRRADGRLMVRGEELSAWRIKLPGNPLVHGGEAFFPLDALRGLSYRMDEATQSLDLEAAPGLFEATILKREPGGLAPTSTPWGGFLNYDLNADHSRGKTTAGALAEVAAFGPWGAGTSNFVARVTDKNPRIVRRESTWTLDRPASLASVRFGDAVSAGGAWGRSVRFGGVQWATNFATQPEFITFPLPGLSGEAVLPSTVDLYVNEALRMRREVPTGPFSIQDLPIVTGMGEARLVVRDALGREHTITQPYYASPRLLQQGLHDYSYEMGFVRENFGIASNDYGRFAAVATHRLGLTDRVTAEAHGELLARQQTLGASAALVMPSIGVLHGAAAASRTQSQKGALASLGFERQARRFSVGAYTQWTTPDFTQLGMAPGQRAPRHTSQAFMSWATPGYGSLGVSLVHQAHRDREDVKLVSANYGLTLGTLGFLSLSAMRSMGPHGQTSVGLTFTRPLADNTSVNASVNAQAGEVESMAQLQRSLPVGSGWGYRLGAGGKDRYTGSLSAQNELGTYTLEAARLNKETGVRAGVSGGAAVVGANVFASRRIDDSFAVVKVPDYPNVRVYADNHVVGKTGADGTALVPRLRPYQKNSIRLEQADLPLDAEIDSLEVVAVPQFRSGMVLPFPVKRSRGALISVILEGGIAIPAGAVARIAGTEGEFPSARNGEIYLHGLAAINRIEVAWAGQSCHLDVAFPKTEEPLPHLGEFYCKGVKP